jgi:putative ABC transport system substrate-binding protein
MKRREFITLIGGAAAWPLTAQAQQRHEVWRIGFISGATRATFVESGLRDGFLLGMREQGHIEGKDFIVEWRFAEGNYQFIPQLAAELIAQKVDVIVLGTSAAVRPVQEATKTVPIIMAYSVDPVGNGLVESLSHPGGNTTGLASSLDDTAPKQIELMAEAVPGLKRIGVLHNPDNPHSAAIDSAGRAARTAGLALIAVKARAAADLELAFQTLVNERANGVIIFSDPFFIDHRRRIAELGLRFRIPTMFSQREYIIDGGFMSYGEPLSEFFRRAAYYVDKILKGAMPADLPVEQPTRFLLVINLKTAKALGLTVPPTLLTRADEVIE